MTDDINQTTFSPIDFQIGQRVRERRHQLGLSQEALSDEIDISYQQVQKYERGANRIPAATLFTISQVFGLPLSYFFEGLPEFDTLEEAAAEKQAYAFLKSQEGVELAAAFWRLSAEKRRFVVLTVKGLLALYDTP